MKILGIIILAIALAICEGREPSDGRIVAAYSTRTALVLTTITTTRPYTCYNENGVNACQKRRFRRTKANLQNVNAEVLADDLTGSLLEEPTDEASSQREGRIALTVWTTSSSTFTVTSTSVNSSSTFSLSYFCTIAGFAPPPACG